MQIKSIGIIFVLFALFVAGCFHEQAPPPPSAEPPAAPPPPPSPPPGVVITTQQNYTVVVPTQPPASLPPPTSSPLPVGYTSTPEAGFVVYFLSVGTPDKQGDAIFIKKGDLDVLVDAGPVEQGATVRTFLRERGIDDIEVWVSTHADEEHYGAMANVLEEFRVEEVWWPDAGREDGAYASLLDRLEQGGASMRSVQKGDEFELNGFLFEVLNPRAENRFGDLDNDAIALRVTDRYFCLLLTSDIQAGPQADLANMPDAECAIMQAPYHGLGRGNARLDLALLNVHPTYLVVSGGPNEEIGGARAPLFERLSLRGIDYFETYVGGTIRIDSDGINYNIDYLPPPDEEEEE